MENLDDNTSCFVLENSKTIVKREKDIQAPIEAELNYLYGKLNACKSKPVAVSLIYPYSESFVTNSRTIQTVPDLYNEEYLNMQYNELLEAWAKVNIGITPEKANVIEEDTRKQSSSNAFLTRECA